MNRILVVELLHADRALYQSAPESMKEEGRAMLVGIVSDLCDWPDSEIVVAVASNVRDLSFGVGFPVTQLVCEDISGFLGAASDQGQFFDVAFCIAPEEAQLLRRTVLRIRQCVPRVICVRDELIRLGGDKLAFHDWCVEHSIATISVLDPGCCEAWCVKQGDLVIAKSRFGAGCEGIKQYRWGAEVQRLVAKHSEAGFVWQPFVAGQFYSVGVIGRGAGSEPVVLPVVKQFIDWSDASPKYLGGQVPCSGEISNDPGLVELVEKLVSALAVDDGYVGLDLVHCPADSESSWRVVELNPRLCTSYLGYRELFSGNLASCWWRSDGGNPCIRADKVVKFHVRMR